MAKAEKIIVVNTGVCAIFAKGVKLMPGDEIEITEKDLSLPGFEALISKGEMTVKDNSALNAEIVERANKKKKKDPTEGKSVAELEDGGTY